MIVKIIYEEIGGHTHMTCFVGREEGRLGNAGNLCMRNEEFAVFKSICEPMLWFEQGESGYGRACRRGQR